MKSYNEATSTNDLDQRLLRNKDMWLNIYLNSVKSLNV